MDAVIQEFKESKSVGIPMNSVDPEFLEDDTYTCIQLYNYDGWFCQANDAFPLTCKFLKDKFGTSIRQAFFATMHGPKFLAPHRNTDTESKSLRYHLGVDVHKDCDGVLKVGKQVYKWEEGVDFVFDTKKTHSVYKSSDYRRTILVVDFIAK